LTDPGLLSLTASGGALSPAFTTATTAYALTLPPGTTSLTLTASVRSPSHATITVGGASVESGTPSATINASFALLPVSIVVTTDGGASRAYTVVIQRSRPTYFKASNTGAGDTLGAAIAVSADGSTLAVGAPQEASSTTGIGGGQPNDLAAGAGAVYVFARSGATWSQQAYIKAFNAEANDLFGSAVALSGDGATLAVGAPRECSNATGVNGDQTNNGASAAGAAYLFTRDGETWTQRAYVKASNTDSGDSFGHAVALSADGRTLAVSADQEDSTAAGGQTNNDNQESGAVYLFIDNGTEWVGRGYLKASNAGMRDYFGQALALSGDGLTLAVGAPYEDSSATSVNGNENDNNQDSSGAAYVFFYNGVIWLQQAYVKASNTEGSPVWGDNFGSAVALSADGSTLAVGARQEGSSAKGINGDQTNNNALGAGAVYVFVRTDSTWAQEAYVKASNTGGSDYFGGAVALSADGSTLAVGATSEDSSATGVNGDQTNDGASGAGAVYLFTRASDTWSQQAYIKASNTGASNSFGAAISLTADGRTLAVGAPGESSSAVGVNGDQTNSGASAAGAAYVY